MPYMPLHFSRKGSLKLELQFGICVHYSTLLTQRVAAITNTMVSLTCMMKKRTSIFIFGWTMVALAAYSGTHTFVRVVKPGLYVVPASFLDNAVAGVEELEERADHLRAASYDFGQSVVDIKINDTRAVDAPVSVVGIKINVEISQTLAAPELSLKALSNSTAPAPAFREGPGSIGWNPKRDSGQDVLMTFREFNCQTKASILSVLKFVRPPPAMIHVVIKEKSHCPAMEKLVPGKITCYSENTVLPGVNYETLATAFKVRGAKNKTVSWYFQQFIKLGFPLFNDISPNFLVWDADNVLIRPYSPVDERGRVRVLYGGNNPSRSETNYVRGYKEMVNATMEKSPDRSSYVVHQALFNKNSVYELLNRMGGHDCGNVSAKTCAQELNGYGGLLMSLKEGNIFRSMYTTYLM
jgi:hypothetical protein